MAEGQPQPASLDIDSQLGVSIVLVPRVFNVHYVQSTELEMLVTGYNSLFATLFGAAISAFLTILITVLTVDLSDRALGIFVGAGVATGGLSLLLGGLALRERSLLMKQIESIKQRPPTPGDSRRLAL